MQHRKYLLLNISFVISVASVVIMSSCYQRTYVPARNYDYSSYYTAEKTKAMPSYVVYNLSDSVSRLYFTVKSTDLLYSRSNVDNQLTAHIIVSYVLHSIEQPKAIADSGHIFMNDINESGALKNISGYADFDVPMKGNYFLDVTLRDLNKMTVSYEMVMLSNSDENAPNNFMLAAGGTFNPLFRSYVGKDEKFSIHHSRSDITKLNVEWYKNISEAARPPYAAPTVALEIAPDSTWSIEIGPEHQLTFPNEGYYRFTVTGSQRGFILCRFPDGFPKVTTPIALLEPMRYITTKKEYTTLQTSSNLKHSVDSFWISTGGSHDRARELISAYYGRVEIANIHFSTSMEGWKSDRGMVYIIYGEPQNVYRTPTSETWVYGQDQSGNMLNFVFDRKTGSNEFVLQRNQVYNISWITAVDYWKQGQVYRAR